ncbi:MAG TPA: F0F1 ATP synthase subunit alpha [Kofleriaceae bacterium]|nr:F0F1 ATP synthase subunit alpha [Kofleriaceae bacterium]
MRPLADELAAWLPAARARAAAIATAPRLEEVGRVEHVGDGVASVSGLPHTRLEELLVLADGTPAFVTSLDPDRIGCVLLGEGAGVAAGTRVANTGEVVRVPVGEALLGRVVDSLGRPLDGGAAIVAARRDPVHRPAPAVIERDFVTRPLLTGITVIDAVVPLGRGQRELVLGDRKLGKTAIAIDTLVNQHRSDVICVYAAVGQKDTTVAQVIDAIRAHGAPERCIIVAASADAPPGLQWLAPYAACTMAEYFRDRGQDALLVIDDLTTHAAVHRQISLLLREPPGREAYPGDVFYIHARLLERAASLAHDHGGGSLTALVIAETQAGNLSAYIPTNLISITDGQIYLEPTLFQEGQRPAVNVGLSVSRVGGKTQAPALRTLSERLRLDYAQFLELEVFTRFGGTMDERTRRAVAHGRRIRAAFSQRQLEPLRLADEVALLLALVEGVFDTVPLDRVDAFKEHCRDSVARRAPAIFTRIDATGELVDADRAELLAMLREAAAPLAGGGT